MVKKVMKKTITETTDEDGSKKTVVKEHAPKEHKKKASGEKKMTAREREELLVENFVGLQHAMTNMSIKFGSLSDNIAKLLQVFEEAAKTYISGGKTDDQDMLKKIDSLLDQNKTIAQGLVLMEGKLRGRADQPVPPTEPPRSAPTDFSRPQPKPLPRI